MTFNRLKGIYALTLLVVMLVMVVGAAGALAKPVKLESAVHIANGFKFPKGVAVAQNGDIYVADSANNRVQELTPTGSFVLMFGWDVNETKEKEGAPQEERNICTAASGDKCQPGAAGTDVGQFDALAGIVADPSTKDVYVQERSRVDEYTDNGEFQWMIGKKTNLTTGANLCTLVSKDVCGPGEPSGLASTEHGAFKSNNNGQQLAVGGPEKLLYIGDEQRVQEFDEEGDWKGEIALKSVSAEPESTVVALAVNAAGNVYLVYQIITQRGGFAYPEHANIIRSFDASGKEVRTFIAKPREERLYDEVTGMALDGEGHLAVAVTEAVEGGSGTSQESGLLFNTETGRLVTRFALPSEVSKGLTFDVNSSQSEPDPNYGYMYAAVEDGEVVAYKPVNVAELVAGVVKCVPGEIRDTDVRLNCGLSGEVNPWGVAKTEVWFEWGLTEALSEVVPQIDGHLAPIDVPGSGEMPLPVSAEITSVRPNEAALHYRLAGYDENSGPPEEPEPLTSETASFATEFVAPIIAGEPNAPYVRSSAAVLFAELNPENASTKYEFQYAPVQPCEEREGELGHKIELNECPGMLSTPGGESSAYGKIGTSEEVVGLQPNTAYRYRLVALAKSENQKKLESLEADSTEVSFTTTQAAVPTASTGLPSAVGTTSATLSGSVNPDGESATYTFELGVYAGAATQYETVFSGSAGAGSSPVEELLPVNGLQPDTTYAYRVTVKSGYTPAGEAVLGAAALFTTGADPSSLPGTEVPAILEVPPVMFPREQTKAVIKELTRAQKLAQALKACEKLPKRRRAGCESKAHKKYGAKGKPKK